jgi:hypothetical protein
MRPPIGPRFSAHYILQTKQPRLLKAKLEGLYPPTYSTLASELNKESEQKDFLYLGNSKDGFKVVTGADVNLLAHLSEKADNGSLDATEGVLSM